MKALLVRLLDWLDELIWPPEAEEIAKWRADLADRVWRLANRLRGVR